MGIFLRDITAGRVICWAELLNDLSETTHYNPYCYNKDYYGLFKHIIISMLLGREIILLDYDFSKEELINLTGRTTFESLKTKLHKSLLSYRSKEELINQLRDTDSNWKLTLFTSGTTGIPKKVTHSFSSISRFVKVRQNKAADVWGFAYNPTHIAGIQVFLQALLNGNTIVRLFELPRDMIFAEINQNRITNISATPTFYRFLLPPDRTCPSVCSITVGGERLNSSTIQSIKKVFPNARITNVYASTEAGTLFASEGELFVIKEQFKDLIKIEDNELLVHQSLLGESEFKGRLWYKTGDMVEVIEKNQVKFRIVTRKNDIINVGGYKVNPYEVEEVIKSIQGVREVKVYKKNSSVLGSIVVCDIIAYDKRLDEKTIRQRLQGKLQEFKIPRIINFVNDLSLSRSGKIKRC